MGNILKSFQFLILLSEFPISISFTSLANLTQEFPFELKLQLSRTNRREKSEIVVIFVIGKYQLVSAEHYNINDYVEDVRSKININLDQDIYIGVVDDDEELNVSSSSGCNNAISIQFWETYKVKNVNLAKKLGNFKKSFDFVCGESNGGFYHSTIGHFLQYEIIPKVNRRLDFHGALMIATVYNRTKTEFRRSALFQNEEENLQFTSQLVADSYLDLKTLMNFSGKVIIGFTEMISFPTNESHADFSAYQLVQTLKRAETFVMLHPTINSNYEAFFRKTTTNQELNAHLYPFQTHLWICIGATWLLYYGIMLLVLQKLKNNSQEMYFTAKYKLSTQWDELLWWILGFLTTKPCHNVPGSYTLRSGFITGALFGLALYLCYSAMILSFLRAPVLPIKSFEDLLKHNYVFTVHYKSQPMQDILAKIIDENDLKQKVETIDSANQITHLLEGSSISTIAYRDLFYKEAFKQDYTQTFLCNNIVNLPISRRALHSSYILKRGSEFTETFNYAIIKTQERGFNQRYFEEYDVTQGGLLCQQGMEIQERKQLRIDDVFAPFSVLGLGFLISIFIILFEFRNQSKHQPKDTEKKSSLSKIAFGRKEAWI